MRLAGIFARPATGSGEATDGCVNSSAPGSRGGGGGGSSDLLRVVKKKKKGEKPRGNSAAWVISIDELNELPRRRDSRYFLGASREMARGNGLFGIPRSPDPDWDNDRDGNCVFLILWVNILHRRAGRIELPLSFAISSNRTKRELEVWLTIAEILSADKTTG